MNSHVRNITGSGLAHLLEAMTLLSLVIFISVLLFSGLMPVIMGELVIERWLHPGGYPDPFAAYADILPGKLLIDMLGKHTCERVFVMPGTDYTCTIQTIPEDFDRVIVTVLDGTIREVQFVPADLVVIDVVRHWGQPDSIKHMEQTCFMEWDSGMIAVANPCQRFSYLLPVSQVLLYTTRSQCYNCYRGTDGMTT